MLTHTTIPAAMLVSSSIACYAIMLFKNNTKPRLAFWLAAFVIVCVCGDRRGPCDNARAAGDEATLVTCSSDTSIKVWNVAHQKCMATLSEHTDYVKALAYASQRCAATARFACVPPNCLPVRASSAQRCASVCRAAGATGACWYRSRSASLAYPAHAGSSACPHCKGIPCSVPTMHMPFFVGLLRTSCGLCEESRERRHARIACSYCNGHKAFRVWGLGLGCRLAFWHGNGSKATWPHVNVARQQDHMPKWHLRSTPWPACARTCCVA
jgi:hypothetical protein